MEKFVKDSFKQYQGQTNLKHSFKHYNEQIYATFHDSAACKNFVATEPGSKEEDFFLCLIEPIVEVAWADGSVTSRETDALIQIANSYGLVDCEETYCKLIQTLLSRPAPKQSARNWNRFYKLLVNLSAEELEIVSEAITIQARFVAERSSNNLIDFLRGDSICKDETTVLEKIKVVLMNLEDKKKEEQNVPNEILTETKPKELEKLLPLVPLVKVAWAEGRVTNREKRIIFEAAYRWGITSDNPSFQQLNEWLELNPTDDFYNESLKSLKTDWEKLDSQDRTMLHLDILSDCTQIAEASGGNSDFAGGGPRICDEEIFAVKQIARKLKFRQPLSLA